MLHPWPCSSILHAFHSYHICTALCAEVASKIEARHKFSDRAMCEPQHSNVKSILFLAELI